MEQEFESRLLENAVNGFATLPGIGRKTALRLVLYLLKRPEKEVADFAGALTRLRSEIGYCRECHNISESEVCPICSNPRRDHSTVMVVENVKDVMIVERTGRYRGVYHVLGGLISPMDGIGPQDLEIESLVSRVRDGGVSEVILALSATMEGDTTGFYLYRKLSPVAEVSVTVLARGVSVGSGLEYTDDLTLSRSIEGRTPFESSLSK